jgi:hypothetical protein
MINGSFVSWETYIYCCIQTEAMGIGYRGWVELSVAKCYLTRRNTVDLHISPGKVRQINIEHIVSFEADFSKTKKMFRGV